MFEVSGLDILLLILGTGIIRLQYAFASCNLFLLCARCNREEAHQREWAFRTACDRYGEGAVRAWYASLELRASRYEFMP